MQVYAIDTAGKRLFVTDACRGTDYFCLECHGIVRLRGGKSLRQHFFHLNTPQQCRLAAKSAAHLAIQNFLQAALGDRAEQEVRFDKIGRIADVASFPQKCVFEVQCSPISEVEVAQRIADYNSIGWQVIWILHDRLYKQSRHRSCQKYLASHCHYYAHTDNACVTIYDELRIRWGRYAGPILYKNIVDVGSTIDKASWRHIEPAHLPSIAQHRLHTWNLACKNDLLWSILFEGTTLQWKKNIKIQDTFFSRTVAAFKRIAIAFWQLLLYKTAG